MSINSSLSLNGSHRPHLLNFTMCLESTVGLGVFSAFSVTNFILLLPLSTLVIYVGLQKWRLQRTNSTVVGTSPTDLFTYHTVAIEIFGLIGSINYCVGNYTGNIVMTMLGFYLFSIVLTGQNFFHCLTCVERYLAVVHPITYLQLKRTRGALITNVSLTCVWLLSCVWVLFAYLHLPFYPLIPFLCCFMISLLISSFCSLSVLWILTRPGPGDGCRTRTDRSKQRAFHTITVILAALVLRLVGFLLCLLMFGVFTEKYFSACLIIKSSLWFCLPSSLVLPLLFLQRAAKPACLQRKDASR